MFLVVLLVGLCMPMMADRYYSFNAAAVDADGLPHAISVAGDAYDGSTGRGAIILNSSLTNNNSHGSAEARRLGAKMALENWNLVSLSRDFNYHGDFVSAFGPSYVAASHKGGIITGLGDWIENILSEWNKRADVDGIGFLVTKDKTFTSNNTSVWTNYSGAGDGTCLRMLYDETGSLEYDELDNYVKKGFHYYTVTIAEGVLVDVYVVHMDTGGTDGDNEARSSQLTQLKNAIINNKSNERPIIVMGGTNSYYTRDPLIANFIKPINDDSNLEIKDAWVEFTQTSDQSKYPTSVENAVAMGGFGPENGEPMSKIFYINHNSSNLTITANTFRVATEYEMEGNPVVVNFTIKETTTATDDDQWTAELEIPQQGKPTWEGEQVVSGTTYYLMNVGTGEYVKWGGAYYTQAVAGNGGTPIIAIKDEGSGMWKFKTTNRGELYMGDGGDVFLDQNGAWILEPIGETNVQYRLKSFSNGNYLSTTPSEAHKPIRTVAKNESDDNQKWIFLTEDRILTEMNKANADYPFNFTALLQMADFDVIEFEDHANNLWNVGCWSNFNTTSTSNLFMPTGAGWGWDPNAYSTYAYANTTATAEMSQDLGTLPKGKYQISFKGFYNAKAKNSSGGSVVTQNIDAKVSFGTGNVAIPQNTDVTDAAAAHHYFLNSNNTWSRSGDIVLAKDETVKLTVSKPKTNTNAGSEGAIGVVCVDHFKLLYYGDTDANSYLEFRNQVIQKMNDTYAKVLELNEAGQRAYDISLVVYYLKQNMVTDQSIVDMLCHMIDEAYLNALAAHRAASTAPDIMLINPSFETGDLTGWTKSGNVGDVGVKPNSDGTYATSGAHQSYIFNSWNGDLDKNAASVYQTIKYLKNGLYELKASVASFAQGEGGAADNFTVYLFGNTYHKGFKVSSKSVFKEATLYFLVENGDAVIGAVGGDGGTASDGDEFQYFDPNNGSFFKADNFRLKYICDVPNGRVKLALDEVKNATIDTYGSSAIDVTAIENNYNNKSYTYATADAAVASLRTMLNTAGKAQGRKYDEENDPSDMTWAIKNPSFENGSTEGWTHGAAWDARMVRVDQPEYAVGAGGRYLFNLWNNQPDIENSGVNSPIYQELTRIKNGKYRLTAMVASDPGNKVYIAAKDGGVSYDSEVKYSSSDVVLTGANYMKKVSVEFEVTQGKAIIYAVGGKSDGTVDVNNGGCWYKVDDFHLQYIGHELTLSEGAETLFSVFGGTDWYTDVTVGRAIKGNDTWSSVVLPFDMPVPAGWEVKGLTSSTYAADKITMTFTGVNQIVAGTPYMVRFTGEELKTLGLDTVDVDYVDVTTATETPYTNDIEFVGVYQKQKVPAGSFYISNNVFKQSVEGKEPTIRAFRAYFKPKVKAMSLSFRAGEDTGIDSAEEEVTVVGIYTLDGVRINDMQEGVNILQMSNGTSIKVIFN